MARHAKSIGNKPASVGMPPDVKAEMVELAWQRRMSFSQLVVTACRELLERDKAAKETAAIAAE